MDVHVRRTVVALVPAVLVGVGSLIALTVLTERLPERAFGTGGYRDSMPWPSVLAVALAWSLGIAVVSACCLYGRRWAPTAQRWVGPGAWIAAALAGGVVAQLVERNLDLVGPPARPDVWWTAPVVAVPVLLLLAAAAWWAMGPDPQGPAATGVPGPDAPRLRLAPRERVLWTRSVVSRRGLAIAGFWVLMTIVSVVSGAGHDTPTLYALLAILAGVQAWARVRVDDRGVRVVQPLLRRELIGVDLREVVQAEARHFGRNVLPRGAYGLVHAGRLAGYRATPGGEVLRLDLSAGREFVVTVPGAATAAALVNAELDRRRAGADAGPC